MFVNRPTRLLPAGARPKTTGPVLLVNYGSLKSDICAIVTDNARLFLSCLHLSTADSYHTAGGWLMSFAQNLIVVSDTRVNGYFFPTVTVLCNLWDETGTVVVTSAIGLDTNGLLLLSFASNY